MSTRPAFATAMKTILLDVGGTFIKCSDGREIPIDSDGSREDIANSLKEALADAEKAAVAIPGPFDYEHGIFLMKHKFAAVYGECFAVIIGGNREYRFIHDVNAMLLGEMASGAGKAYERVALVTLGTGLGFSMSLDGHLLMNELGSPLVPVYNLPFGGGILEDYVSKRGFLRGYQGLTVKELAQRAGEGDRAALERFADRGTILASCIAPILKEYGIQCLLFGGQISRSYFLLAKAVEEGLRNVDSLQYAGPVQDIGNATFNGLKTLL